MILDRIVKENLQALEDRKRKLPAAELRRLTSAQPTALDLGTALRGDGIRLIAEVKRASPSQGVIRQDFDPVKIAKVYAGNGASAISILTEARYFQGSLEHLKNIRAAVHDKIPLLRKDFIVDPYQVYESRAFGADSLLLIVAILSREKLRELLELSHELNMNCLVEVHDKAEVETALGSGARIIGINNRNLNNFEVDMGTTARLRPLIPADRIVVSESGIKQRADIEDMRRLRVDAVLIGEYFMSVPDISARMRELL